MKTCTKCKCLREKRDFYANKRTSDGLQSWCVECQKLLQKAIYRRNKEKRDV